MPHHGTRRGRPGRSHRRTPIACCCALVALLAWIDPDGGSGARAAPPASRIRITVSHSEHGGIVPSHPAPVAPGSTVRFGIFPRSGYHLDSLFVDGEPVRPESELVLSDVRGPHRVTATFARSVYVIVATSGPHVTVTPSGLVPVPHGRSQSFLFAADPGYQVNEVLVDGSAVRPRKRYTFTSVEAEHRILVRTEHHAATVIAPEPGELWLAGETREVRWQPLEKEDADSAEVRVSYHGPDGPWETIWRGLFRTGSADWEVPALDCDSLVLCVATVDSGSTPGLDYSSGLVRVRSTVAGDGATLFYVRASPSPAPVGPVRLDYSVPIPGEATLEIFTVNGREVWRWSAGFTPTGRRSATWDGRLAGGGPAQPGVYFARLTTHSGVRNCRLVLLP